MAKLDVRAFGLATGILWGGCMFLLGLINTYYKLGGAIEQTMGTLYIGYKSTLSGSIIGGIWGFIDAGLGGVILAWLYNKFSQNSNG